MHVRDILNACLLQMHAYFNEMLCKVYPMHGVLMRFKGYLVCKDSQIYLHPTVGMFLLLSGWEPPQTSAAIFRLIENQYGFIIDKFLKYKEYI